MSLEIEKIIEQVSKLEREYGLSEWTIANYFYNYYKSIIHFCKEENEGLYSSQILLTYLENKKENYEKGMISQHRYADEKRCVNRVIQYVSEGEIHFKKSQPLLYHPSESGMNFYNSIVDDIKSPKLLSNNNQAIIRNFICYLEKHNIAISNVSDQTFFDFMSVNKENYKCSQGYLRQSLQLISSYLNANDIAYIKTDFSMFQLKGSRTRVIEPFSQLEIKQILESVDTSTAIGLRDRAIILLAYATGLRAIDITLIQFSDIDWYKATISLSQSKTGHPVILPLNATTMNAVSDYILHGRPTSPNTTTIFISHRIPFSPLNGAANLGNIARKYCDKASITKKPGRNFHALRRSFATDLSASEVPLPIISQLLGHKSANSATPYLSYNRVQMLRCALGFEDIPLNYGVFVSQNHMEGDV